MASDKDRQEYYGLLADMEPILEITARHGLAVVEDAAEAHGARYKGRLVGALVILVSLVSMAIRSLLPATVVCLSPIELI